MNKFKVGERYKVTENCFFVKIPMFINDEIGNVIEIENIENDTVYYKTVKGSKFSSKFKSGSSFAYGLVPVHNNKIIITADGKTTTAKMYDGKKLVKSAKADCHPDDEFDFNIGATIALERLTGKTAYNGVILKSLTEMSVLKGLKHLYHGKVVCVNNVGYEKSFTVGKVYDVEFGEIAVDEDKGECGVYIGVESVEEFNARFPANTAKFLEIVE